MTAETKAPTQGLNPEIVAQMRPKVQAMLTAIPSFAQLTPEEQKALAFNMVKLTAAMADPGGLVTEAQAAKEAAPARAMVQESKSIEAARQNLAGSGGFAGKDFVAGAAVQGVEQFGALVQKVDFPAFVGGLINNVFGSIVESSIEQMRAYGELVAAVAKSTEDYMNENIGMGAGRDWLSDRFPDMLSVETDDSAGTSRLKFSGSDEEAAFAEINNTLGVEGEPITDISDDEQEARLVNAARMQMAKSKQQLLASMVMLGINRIVVTDGSITAKVKFSMRSEDTAKRDYKASMYDRQAFSKSKTSAFGGSFLGFGGGSVTRTNQSHVAQVATSKTEGSTSELDMEAKLQGEVRVNFKSDYLPLEKMATPAMIGAIQGNSTPTEPKNMAKAPAQTAGAGG